jgi:hypothetical protein
MRAHLQTPAHKLITHNFYLLSKENNEPSNPNNTKSIVEIV